jgi:DNA recombination protein RmuC
MLVAVLIASLVTCAVVVAVLLRQLALQQSTTERFATTERSHERVERGLREELGRARDESRMVLRDLGATIDGRLASLAKTVDERLQALQVDNAQKLEQMRTTVDEKLQGTLERRLGESFKLVSDRLELVHKGWARCSHSPLVSVTCAGCSPT